MSAAQQISLNLRATGNLTEFVLGHGADTLKTLGNVATYSPEIVVVELVKETTDAMEGILGKGINAVEKIRQLPGFPNDADVSLWVVLASEGEFAGVVISSDLVERAARVRAAFVFSVYCSQTTNVTI
jgi:hypothetical protein